ncbi:MAG: peptidase [Symploca sp. SIO1A3]|nr:peptidase [Symploca sp. SIO2C1]NER50716.1 peptidase [Symploca sp. SIO1A3]
MLRNLMHLWGRKSRPLILFVAFAISLLVVLTQLEQVDAQTTCFTSVKPNSLLLSKDNYGRIISTSNNFLVAEADSSQLVLPNPQTHPLPRTLEQWENPTGADDYFSEIKPTPAGYLVWSEFPVKVYVERPTEPPEASASAKRFQYWFDDVLKAVEDWSIHLPLNLVTQAEDADISILRSSPPLKPVLNRETGRFDLPRARSAEASYEFYLREAVDAPYPILSHKFTILLSPDHIVEQTTATARHELGHALGIWGHSPLETDALYFSKVRNPPPLSPRDINTLKQIYQQPTRLGWPLVFNEERN